jgi:N-acetylglucosaminyl-diphospho-decaprenol L-rhamnosyltransferase
VTDLAVILVAWNVRGLVLDALRSLYSDLHTTNVTAQVWVVDNASSDGTPQAIRAEFPDVQLLASQKNLGFAAGNNLALRALGFCDQPTPNPAGPRAVFLLNPDTLVQHGAVRALYDALFSLPRAGLVGAQLAYADGSLQHSAFRFPGLAQIVIDLFPVPARLYESRLNGRYPRTLYSGREPFAVDHTLGATMMLRRAVIEQTGLFDEQFFMYCEEIDWSMRIRQAGWQIYVAPEARITHLESQSTGQIRPASLVNLWTSRLRLYSKYYSPVRRAAACQLVRIGLRLQIRKAQQSETLTTGQKDALIGAYRTVIERYATGRVP